MGERVACNSIKTFPPLSLLFLFRDLSSNRIRELPDNVFGHLRNLKTL